MKECNFFESQTRSSRIKANIVSNYFPKYCKILLKKEQKQIRYLDLYAGPGIYDDGNYSTPILIGKACASDPVLKYKVLLMFNDNEHIESLKRHFTNMFPSGTFLHEPRFGDRTVGDDEKITEYLKKKSNKSINPNPTLLFFDPFGYKGINTKILAEFLGNWGNEMFLFFNIKRIHAAIENEKFDALMQELFPTTIEKLRNDRKYVLSVQDRLALIIENLSLEFNRIIPTLFHCAFKFQEEDCKTTSHYIIHFTKHQRGYDLVKQIYNEFDNIGASLGENGDYTFDAKNMDNENNQFDFGDANIYSLAKLLDEQYNGKKMLALELFEEHQRKTKYCRKHYCDTLRWLVDEGKVKSSFLDDVAHTVTVLINENCMLEFV